MTLSRRTILHPHAPAAGASASAQRSVTAGFVGLAALAALAVLTTLPGCGGVELERAPGAKKYRALPLGTPVNVSDAVDALPQPTEVLGILRLTTTTPNASQDKDNAIEQLKRFAARYGCDAIVGVEAETKEKLFKRKVKKLGADGRPVYEEEVRRSYDHLWHAQCVRTAEAPAEQARAVAGGRGATTSSAGSTGAGDGDASDAGGKTTSAGDKPTSGGASSAGASAGGSGSAGAGSGSGSTTSGGTSGTTSGGASGAAGSATSGGSGGATSGAGTSGGTDGGTTGGSTGGAGTAGGTPGVIAVPPADDTDPALASEIARAFLALSRYIATANHDAICNMIDKERLYLDIRIEQPVLEIKTDLTHDAACAALKEGDLSIYVRNFGPAEVHTEMPTLIPTLFRVHGGAFLKLSDAQDALYRKKVEESRVGKTPLACEMYTVHAAGNLFKISLDCRGVKSYRLLLRRDGPDDFKLMALTHNR